MNPDDILPGVEKVVSQERINEYAEASRDFNPLHRDPEFAKNTHYGRVVAHGMLVLAYISEMMTQTFGRHWVESGHLKIRFRSPVFPGDSVTTFGEVLRVSEDDDGLRLECYVGCRNQDGEEVINGEASVTMPGKPGEDVTR